MPSDANLTVMPAWVAGLLPGRKVESKAPWLVVLPSASWVKVPTLGWLDVWRSRVPLVVANDPNEPLRVLYARDGVVVQAQSEAAACAMAAAYQPRLVQENWFSATTAGGVETKSWTAAGRSAAPTGEAGPDLFSNTGTTYSFWIPETDGQAEEARLLDPRLCGGLSLDISFESGAADTAPWSYGFGSLAIGVTIGPRGTFAQVQSGSRDLVTTTVDFGTASPVQRWRYGHAAIAFTAYEAERLQAAAASNGLVQIGLQLRSANWTLNGVPATETNPTLTFVGRPMYWR